MKAIALVMLVAARVASAGPNDEPKNPDTALALSVGGVVASGATMLGATGGNATWWIVGAGTLVITPSFGHLYAADYMTWGLGLRLAAPLAIYLGSKMSCVNPDGDGCSRPGNGQILMYGLGAGAFVTGIVLDLATARSAARDYNREHAVTVAPAPISGGYGLAVVGRF